MEAGGIPSFVLLLVCLAEKLTLELGIRVVQSYSCEAGRYSATELSPNSKFQESQILFLP